MKILHLTLKKKWFDMVASGEKKEEYRDVKPYWIQRFTWHEFHKCDFLELIYRQIESDVFRHDFDAVCFRNGYNIASPTITIELKEIYISKGQEEWGADPSKNYFVITLGKIIQP